MKNKKKYLMGTSLVAAGIVCLAGVGVMQSSANQVPVTAMSQSFTAPADAGTKNQKQADGTLKSDDWYVEAGVKAIETYFGLDGNGQLYSSMVQYLPAMPEIGLAPSVNVSIWPKGQSDELTAEDIEKSHMIEFAEDGTIKAMFVTPNKTGALQTPASVEDAKRIAREFATQKKLAGDHQLECLGGAFITSEAITVAFQYNGDKVIEMGVNSRTGNVYYFEYTTKERAMKRITPVEAGSGIG